MGNSAQYEIGNELDSFTALPQKAFDTINEW